MLSFRDGRVFVALGEQEFELYKIFDAVDDVLRPNISFFNDLVFVKDRESAEPWQIRVDSARRVDLAISWAFYPAQTADMMEGVKKNLG